MGPAAAAGQPGLPICRRRHSCCHRPRPPKSFGFGFWVDHACPCTVLINTPHEEKRLDDTAADMAIAKCQRQVQFGCWPAGRCCHRPRLPPTSPAAAAAQAHCTAGQGTRPRCLCRWALHIAARAGACSRLAIGLAGLQGDHRARGRGARPHPPAARPASANSPARPRHSQCQQLQQAEGQTTHRTHQTQPSRTNHSRRETQPNRFVSSRCRVCKHGEQWTR